MSSTRQRPFLFDRLLGLIEHPRLSDRIVLRALFFLSVASGLWWILSLNHSFVVLTPTSGGSFTEGVIGIPRFVNPALAITRADQDAVALVYSGLLRLDSSGNLAPDLAERIDIAEGGTTYHVFMRKNRSFQDGTPITARDAIFTIELLRNPDLKSPLRGNWSDVTITEINEYEFTITLPEAYAPFIENFTIGIMPRHIWGSLPIEQLPFSQYNTEPVGSGPFMIDTVNRDASGLISSYELIPSPFGTTKPNIDSIVLRFYQNEDSLFEALQAGEIDATAFLSPTRLSLLDEERFSVLSTPLPRIFGLFINQNRSAPLRDTAARLALSEAIDREAIVSSVLSGYGVPTTRPTIELSSTLESNDTELSTSTNHTDRAVAILEAAGWRRGDGTVWQKKIGQETETLAVTLRTGNSPLYDSVANLVAEDWRALGVEVQVEQYEQTGLVQSVIRNRDYQVLLFGLDMNRQQDLYPFWHSSQRDDPGLNVAQYTNVTVDRILEEARTTEDEVARGALLADAADIISSETPAIFLFAPDFTYVQKKNVLVETVGRIGKPADRFMNIEDWHVRTDTVWPLFRND